jgi:pimeloyl-ACP methyl ester carboxylesterase
MASIMSGLLALTMVAASTPSPKPAEKPVSVVLVHGAFVDASGWRAVYDRLTRDGYEVLVVQNPWVAARSSAPSPSGPRS